MRILAIETSCDETAIAVLEAAGGRTRPIFRVAANIVASQTAIHEKWGGVVPNLARRAHEKNLIPILHKALKDAGLLQKSKIPPLPTRLRIAYGQGLPSALMPARIRRSGGLRRAGRRTGKNQTLKSQFKNQEPQTILKREQLLFEQTTKFLSVYQKPNVDVIAVTYGPGLEPALWVGVNFARALALLWGKPLVAVNHMEGHIVASLLKLKSKNGKGKIAEKKTTPRVTFPAVALLVSGGHTELVLMKDWTKYKVLGETLDDAAGEAFDKVARMLGLGYPGGPEIVKYTKAGEPTIPFPRPMLKNKNLDFSFSGLKTAVLYYLQKQKRPFAKTLVAKVAASFQQAVVDVLVAKTLRAVKEHNPKTVLIGGGVAANNALRTQLAGALSAQFPNITLLLPEKSFTGDNAAMIAAAAYFHAKKKAYAGVRTLKASGAVSLTH